ncbi:hypothetical protein ACWDUL_05130 [Nocardia niigatensis]|uniref:hypothetical protein n=1 Tax=Nocardia niigatensis TaxID=209249 RepID=UPI001C3F1F82|nr:hypothetical protein [Nocardia niigatensis]
MTVTAPPIFHGDFETHLTVRAGEAERLERYAAAHGLKFAHIVLERGRVIDQPMLTVPAMGSLPAVRDSMMALAARLGAAGFEVVRVKIEATPWATGVPADDDAAATLGAGYYFEHHVKLLLTPGTDVRALADLAAGHDAHLSANARRTRPDGSAERFVTQRCRLVGDATAAVRHTALLAALRADDYEVLSAEREFVVLDSDESIDAGWITERGDRSCP